MDFKLKLEETKLKLQEISLELSKNETASDYSKAAILNIQKSRLEELSEKLESYFKIENEIKDSESILFGNDEELKQIAEEELEPLKNNKKILEEEIKKEILPQDPADNKSAILEIRAGAGGDEAALFASSLFKMYSRFAERNKLKFATIDSNTTPIGGIKEIIAEISGNDAYGTLKYESGVHRVQRIPETESGGRIHTSTVTVAILPEAETGDVEIKPDDLKIETFRSSGPGGQHAQKSESAIRITHLPTGTMSSCQEDRSQLKNKDKAMKILLSRLLHLKNEAEAKKTGGMRRIQVGTGDRSEKIRTYNFPQNRVTDHRINFSIHNLESVLSGNIDEIIEKLKEADQAKKLALIEKENDN